MTQDDHDAIERRLRSWLPALWNAADNASALYHETNRRAVARPTRAEIPAADADALEALL